MALKVDPEKDKTFLLSLDLLAARNKLVRYKNDRSFNITFILQPKRWQSFSGKTSYFWLKFIFSLDFRSFFVYSKTCDKNDDKEAREEMEGNTIGCAGEDRY